ncbi:hypothetical protein PQQ99_32255 [Paraburkholderia sediminicola]|uniref:hypothetical protein n=1 Tax=Paraburkholderia sediminicola TaxID=458836 RepID=UPI0038BB0EAF
MAKLLDHLRATVSSVRIDLSYPSEVSGRLIETGEVDLATGFMAQLQAGYFRQTPFDDRFVYFVNR